MAEGGFDDMEMDEHNEGTGPFREYTDSQLVNEYSDVIERREKLLDDFRNIDFPDDVRVEYDSLEERLTLIESYRKTASEEKVWKPSHLSTTGRSTGISSTLQNGSMRILTTRGPKGVC